MAGSSTEVGALPGLEWRVDKVRGLYMEVEPLVRKYAARINAIETAVLVMSVATSGAFWALASDVIPKSMALSGAVISTLATFLTIYLYSSGLAKKRKNALLIYKEVGRFMAGVRTNPALTDQEFWITYKLYEGMIGELRYGAADSS